MEQLQHIEETINLGKKLVQEFNYDDRLPMTSRWMAHYLAETITKAEKETNDNLRKKYQQECCELILELWSNRKNLPRNLQPLGNFDKVIPVLEALIGNDPDEPYWRRFQQFEDEDPWGRFIQKTRIRNEDIFNIVLCSSITKQIIDEGRDWLKFPNLISESEKLIIEYLDTMLNRRTNSIEIIYVNPDGSKTEKEKTKLDLPSVFHKLEEILDDQRKELERLKNSVLDEDENNYSIDWLE
jgi:tetratricopeptide (TPR) repeat protein